MTASEGEKVSESDHQSASQSVIEPKSQRVSQSVSESSFYGQAPGCAM